MSIIVAGKLLIQPGQRESFIRASLPAVQAARQTMGCMDFAVSPDPLEENRVNIYECWASESELQNFRESGPSEDLTGLIAQFEVQQYSVK